MRIRALFTVTAATALLADHRDPRDHRAGIRRGGPQVRGQGRLDEVDEPLLPDRRTSGERPSYRIYVRPSTRFARGLKGYRSLRKDLEIEVRASRSPGHRLIARKIELD